jgi:hypothetical protein
MAESLPPGDHGGTLDLARSAPKAARDSVNQPSSEAKRPDQTKIVRRSVRQRAIGKAEEIAHKEADITPLTDDGGFHVVHGKANSAVPANNQPLPQIAASSQSSSGCDETDSTQTISNK